MPTYREIRTAIAGVMETVDDIGVVHERERYLKRAADLEALFLSDGRIRGWVIRLATTRRTRPTLGRYIVTHRWQIRGYMGFDDADESELLFDDLVEGLQAAFKADETLGGTVAATVLPDDLAGLQRDDSGPVMFSGVLCHSARLNLATQHYE